MRQSPVVSNEELIEVIGCPTGKATPVSEVLDYYQQRANDTQKFIQSKKSSCTKVSFQTK